MDTNEPKNPVGAAPESGATDEQASSTEVAQPETHGASEPAPPSRGGRAVAKARRARATGASGRSRKRTSTRAARSTKSAKANGAVKTARRGPRTVVSGQIVGVEAKGGNKTRLNVRFEQGNIMLRPTSNRTENVAIMMREIKRMMSPA